jgi:hypothetical protein
MTFTRLAPGDLLLIAELPEIQTAIDYIMGKIVSAYFASIPVGVNAPRRTNSWSRRRFRHHPSHRMGLQTE